MSTVNFSVCIDSLYKGKPVSEALKSIQEIGFNSYEFWSWWDKDITQLAELQNKYDVSARAFCTKFVSLTDESQLGAYVDGLFESLNTAKTLNCPILISQVGNSLPHTSNIKQHRSIVKGLKECADMLEDFDVILAVEPLNTIKDHKGYYLYQANEAFEIINEVGSSKIKVLYDLYHQQITGDFSEENISKNIYKIAHFHSAGYPHRDELSTQEYNNGIFESIYSAGYAGYIGLEYFPVCNPNVGLQRTYDNYSKENS